jgi:branched-chain amino acid transport system permease protein
VLERTLYRRLYGASHLDQVLFSIGLVFMAISDGALLLRRAAAAAAARLPARPVQPPGVDIGVYRLFLIVHRAGARGSACSGCCRARASAPQLRASVDNPRAARGLGINVDRVFTLTFALGSALAGLGGALGIEMLGLDPSSRSSTSSTS